MKNTTVDFEKYLNFHKEYGGTGKIFKFKFIEYKKGVLKLEGEFTSMALNPNQSVQGGQMNSMLDDVTSLLIIYESQGNYYPSSTNLHSIHHRPLFEIDELKMISKNTDFDLFLSYYNLDGKLRTKGAMVGKNRVGKWVYFFPNGALFSEELYIDGKLTS